MRDVDIPDMFSSDSGKSTRIYISSEVVCDSSKGNYTPQMTFRKSSTPIAAKIQISHQ
jgi:hypothetical protein